MFTGPGCRGSTHFPKHVVRPGDEKLRNVDTGALVREHSYLLRPCATASKVHATKLLNPILQELATHEAEGHYLVALRLGIDFMVDKTVCLF